MADIITTVSPTTGKAILTRTGSTPAEMLALATAAQAAFRAWSAGSGAALAQRQAVVARACELLTARKDVLARQLTQQMGRPIAYADKEVLTAVRRAEYLSSVAAAQLADTPGAPEEGFSRYIRKVPLGVVLIIFPWNYPFITLINSLVPALLADNAVIIKPSPQTPLVAEQIVDIFAEAGLPPRVLQCFHCGRPEDMAPLLQSPLLNHVCFTGSVAGGLAVQRTVACSPSASSAIATTVGLELGGNDPAYVRADLDTDAMLAWAAGEIVDGAVFNSGQSCCAIERVYVHAAVHDRFVQAVQAVLRAYVLGDPADAATQVGPVVSAAARDAIAAQVADALARGAVDATPANASFDRMLASGRGGAWVRPTLLTRVTHDMDVMRNETFGPVIPVMAVRDDDEAVRLMNDSELGLTASVWTRDVAAGERLGERIEAGTVFVNRADYPAPDLAWTGWKSSGKGVTLSKFGFDQFVKLKSFHLKNYPAKL